MLQTIDHTESAPWAGDFVKAPRIHNGKFTFTSPTGKHVTFQIKTQKKDSKFAPGKRVVALLTGPDNQSDYIGFGFVTDDGVEIWSRHRASRNFQWYRQLINYLVGHLPVATKSEKFAGYTVLESRRCLKCNRELTSPESIKSGIGPICEAGY